MMFTLVPSDCLPPSPQAPRPHGVGDERIPAVRFVSLHGFPARPLAQYFAGKNCDNGLDHRSRSVPAMITDPDSPFAVFAANRVCQSDVRIKSGFYLQIPECRRFCPQDGSTELLQALLNPVFLSLVFQCNPV
jgi:hypothetical protein